MLFMGYDFLNQYWPTGFVSCYTWSTPPYSSRGFKIPRMRKRQKGYFPDVGKQDILTSAKELGAQ